jgi:hypothetical protein
MTSTEHWEMSCEGHDSKSVDHAAGEWIREHVEPVSRIERFHERPWATVLRVPIGDDRAAWFKVCAPVQSFEPRLTASLFARWPDRVAQVLGYDEERRWLLLADAGTPISTLGNPPEAWLTVLPLYAELQRGESEYICEHLGRHVPDLRVPSLPARYEHLLQLELPLERDEIACLRRFAPRFARLCGELTAHDVAPTVQHDDLHMTNVYAQGERLLILDWGDAAISHPFASLVVTFQFLEERNHLSPSDPWFARLRDAYLEPWGRGLVHTFELAMRVGAFAHAIAWARQRDALPKQARRNFDTAFTGVLRRAVDQIVE